MMYLTVKTSKRSDRESFSVVGFFWGLFFLVVNRVLKEREKEGERVRA